jgi:MFS family permease
MKKNLFGINLNVFFLGLVSFFNDISSEMIFSVFAVFFTVILGASVALLGVIEGFADFASSSLDYVAGFVSDKTGKRKRFAALGYLISTLAKSILVISSTITSSALFRVVERFGKSFRGPPRDAWISSLSNTSNRGLSFGIHKSLDKAGAIIGPLIAYFILSYYGQNQATFNLLFQIALVPAIIAVIIIALLKDKPVKPAKKESFLNSYKFMGASFRHYLYSAAIFSMAYFSFGFLLLKSYFVGFEIKDIVLLYVLFNIAFVIASAPIGKLGDIIGRKKIIILEYVLYLVMCLGFIFAATKLEVALMFVIFGIFYAIDEGQSKAYIADLEKTRRGIAIGIYNFITGMIYLPASIIAGLLWVINPNYSFVFAGVISIAALIFFSLGLNHKLYK